MQFCILGKPDWRKSAPVKIGLRIIINFFRNQNDMEETTEIQVIQWKTIRGKRRQVINHMFGPNKKLRTGEQAMLRFLAKQLVRPQDVDELREE